MERIHPVSRETCQAHVGRQICAILHDGTHVVGTIESVNDDGIVFSRSYPGVGILSTNAKKAQQQLKQKVQTSAYSDPYAYHPSYGIGVLAWSLIALAFVLPLFYV